MLPLKSNFTSALRLLIGAMLLVAAPALIAQDAAVSNLIEEIEIEFIGVRNVSDQAVRAQIEVREGQEYDQDLIDRSVRTLYATQLFDYIEVRPEITATDNLRLVYVVQPKFRVSAIRFRGNDTRSSRLRREISSRVGAVLDERTVAADRQALLEWYRERGFSDAEIEFRFERDEETGFGEIIFLVEEGDKLRIRSIEFVGNEQVSPRRLRGQMETKKWWFLSWLTGSGRFDDDAFREDLERLRAYYRDLGYLDVDIPESEVALEYPKEGSIAITMRVTEGRQYSVGQILFEGNELFPDLILASILDLIPGDVFSPTTLDEDTERLTDFYGQLGYLDTLVRAERRPNITTGNIDITYRITESEIFNIETVNIEGNTKTKSVVILRELGLAPGSIFNLVFMKNAEARLNNTGFFEEVRLNPEPTNIPNRRNLKVTVREGRTGQFQVGAGFSSLENGVVFLEVTQGNFDLFNWRSFFQGDGQKFRLRLSLGSDSNEIVLSFEEPWLFEQRLAVGFEAYRTETDFNSATYNELRSGIEVYMRRNLFELVNARLSYRYEIVDIHDVTNNAPQIIRDEDGERTVSAIGLQLVRDTRNDYLFPTNGARISLTSTFAGVGGDTEYLKLESRNSFFVPTFEWGEQSISFLGRVGSIIAYSDQRTPFFDRFFLGGPYTLRGFEFRDVGPRGVIENPDGSTRISVDPSGGNSYAMASIEYTYKVADPLRVAVFYDWGFVNTGENSFNPQDYNDNWGIGVRLMVLGSPMRLDYGIPLTTSDFGGGLTNDRGNQFNFSFGTRF